MGRFFEFEEAAHEVRFQSGNDCLRNAFAFIQRLKLVPDDALQFNQLAAADGPSRGDQNIRP